VNSQNTVGFSEIFSVKFCSQIFVVHGWPILLLTFFATVLVNLDAFATSHLDIFHDFLSKFNKNCVADVFKVSLTFVDGEVLSIEEENAGI
jgi:hypothetical protein